MPHTNSVASKISRIDIVDGTCAIIADDVPIANLGTSMAGEGGEGERQRGATSTSSYRPMMRTTISARRARRARRSRSFRRRNAAATRASARQTK